VHRQNDLYLCYGKIAGSLVGDKNHKIWVNDTLPACTIRWSLIRHRYLHTVAYTNLHTFGHSTSSDNHTSLTAIRFTSIYILNAFLLCFLTQCILKTTIANLTKGPCVNIHIYEIWNEIWNSFIWIYNDKMKQNSFGSHIVSCLVNQYF
jgi:hypothetical protein